MSEDRVYYSREAEVRARREAIRLTLICLGLGLSIGAGLALLYAPASGKKIRQDLAKTMEEGLKSGQEAVRPMVKQLEKDFGELRKAVEDRVVSLR